ncbi:splicing factor U2AF auxiliary factor large subunit [Cryptosporidium ryanae]|uniref:splicing factor U2AF auxiliary factor large subunit n=1 Tax=Cryptosporidium ryanae TaxID=515981 RepID=UPI00351A3842|nr:splicing factor U2AF auxiliary factor large subunit [Cryptosporidium ryanae]
MKQENVEIKHKKDGWSDETDIQNVLGRTVILKMVPSSFDTKICRYFLNGMLLTILGDSTEGMNTNKYIENIIEVNLFDDESNNYSNEVQSTLIYNKCFRVTLKSVLTTLLCLKLDNISIGSHGHKIICKRPDEYVYNPSDILDYFTIPNTSECNTKNGITNNKCIISNLPIDINQDFIKKELENFGKLKYLKMLHNPMTGAPNGTCFFEFEEVNSYQKAISTLNGKKINSTKGIWNIQREELKLNPNNYGIQSNIEYKNASYLHSSISYKLFEDPTIGLLMKYSKIIGETPSKVVKLNNVFFPEEVINDDIFNSTIDSVKSEAETYGTIIEITSPRPKNINEYHKNGVGKVFIYFSDITSARRAQYQFNGRVFDSVKIISATFYPTEKYLNREYNIISFVPE